MIVFCKGPITKSAVQNVSHQYLTADTDTDTDTFKLRFHVSPPNEFHFFLITGFGKGVIFKS